MPFAAAPIPARPYIGGQAVIEGVMMRSPGSVAIVCRRRGGELIVHERPMPHGAKGPRSWPLLRGVTTLVESIRLGSRALRWSADIFERDLRDAEGTDRAGAVQTSDPSAVDAGASRPSSADAGASQAPSPPTALSTLTAVALALASQSGELLPPGEAPKRGGIGGLLPIAFAVALFVAAPQASAAGINRLFNLGLEVTSPGFQAITGTAKLLIVVTYLLLIRQVAEVRRVFQYHGAEHKTISTYEAHEELVVANARAKTTMHARCGTTFLVMVALVSIVVFSVAGAVIGGVFGDHTLPGGPVVQNVVFFVLKLPFLPVVVAVTFEIQRLFARYCTANPLRLLLVPGFLVQKITTAEPDDAQLEVALASLRATLWREQASGAPAPPDRTFTSYEQLLADPGYAGGR